MRFSRVIVAVAVFGVSPAFGAKPQIQWNQDYDFSQIGTFMWQPTAGISLERADPFLHRFIINAIEFHLSNSGLTEVESGPDVLVTYYGSVSTDVRLQSDSYGYGWGGFGGPTWARYGYGVGSPVSTTTREVQYERGTLVVDIVDAETSELIWRGTAAGLAVSNNRDKLQKNIGKALKSMVKQSEEIREGAARD